MSAVRNSKVSLLQKSSEHMFLCDRLGPWSTIGITEVSLIRRSVIERFHCIDKSMDMQALIWSAIIIRFC